MSDYYRTLTKRQARGALTRTKKLYDYLVGVPEERVNLDVCLVDENGRREFRNVTLRQAESRRLCGCIAGWMLVMFPSVRRNGVLNVLNAPLEMYVCRRDERIPHKEEALRRLETHMTHLKKILAMLVLFLLPLSAHAESFYPSQLDTAPFNMHDPGPSTTDGAAPVYEPLDLVRHVAPTQLDGLDLAPAPAPAPSPAPLAIEEDLANERAARQARQRLWNSIR